MSTTSKKPIKDLLDQMSTAYSRCLVASVGFIPERSSAYVKEKARMYIDCIEATTVDTMMRLKDHIEEHYDCLVEVSHISLRIFITPHNYTKPNEKLTDYDT